MYRRLYGNLRLWTVQEPVSSLLTKAYRKKQELQIVRSFDKSIQEETGTTNREIVANHLTYTHLYMFLVAVKIYAVTFQKNRKFYRFCDKTYDKNFKSIWSGEFITGIS